MSEPLHLPALLGSHPLGALASFGLLRLVSEWDSSARLAFEMKDDWIASLRSDRFQSIDALITELASWSASDALDKVSKWADDVRISPKDYRKVIADTLEANDLQTAMFIGAIAADGAIDAQKGLVKPGALYMVSGQQSFLGGAREIIAAVRTNADELFREALVGPWTYRTRVHGLGWDPNTERLYAFRHRAPTSEKASCIAGAVLLALWALPLFPAVSRGGRAVTSGFTRSESSQSMSWPIFSTPLAIGELASLLQAGVNSWASSGRLRPGLETCFQSRRFEFGQGYAVFRAPEVTHQQRRES